MAHTPPGRTRERVWRFVRDRLAAGSPPTVREVQEAFGFRAVESARAHLEALVAAGHLEKETSATGRGRARGWRLPSAAARAAVLVPLLGRVQAGAPTTAAEEHEGAVAVHTRLPAEELFALRVRGDSMRDAGILDGDVVLVRRTGQSAADLDGRIVVARVGEEATVKTLRVRRGGAAGTRVELHPAHPDFAPIVPPPGELHVLGRVVEVRRHLDPATSPAWLADAPDVLPPSWTGGHSAPAASPAFAPPPGEEAPRTPARRPRPGPARRGASSAERA